MDRFCRGCLVRYDEPAELLQYTEKNRRLFVYSTALQVKRTDAFTFQLCKDCYLNMKVACSFKKQCRSSDKKLKTYLARKDTGETMDLSTYLKNNDDSWTYKFPMLYGSSTPTHQKARIDDESQSTSASIRNFMTDIMPDTDSLLVTEARIIKEVIEEEADLLDQSLDSHWLQDDVSIDTNFRLDFSFSPFSTSQSLSKAAYSPSKLPEEPVEKLNEQEHTEHNYALSNKVLDMPVLSNSPIQALIPLKVDKECNYEETIDPLDAVNDILKLNEDNNILKLVSEDLSILDKDPDQQCTIDRNLEEALKNSSNKEFALDDLLVSPQVIPGIKTPPTPLINNILFGEKLDMDGISNNSHKYVTGQFIESYENVVGDTEMTEFDIDVKIEVEEIKTEIINEEDRQTDQVDAQPLPETGSLIEETKFYCKMCSRTFSTLKSMKRHADLHTRVLSCDFCGKLFNDRTNLVRHIQTHMRKPAEKYECEACKLEFSSEYTLRKHKNSHLGESQKKTPIVKKFICTECAFSTDKSSNFKIHMRRHEKKFTFTCPECDKGYYRKTELTIHMRYHTGERPFKCTFCDRSFPRRDALTRHIKSHLDKPFKCDYCRTQFVHQNHLTTHLKKSKGCSKTRDKMANDQGKVNEEESSQFLVTEMTMDSWKHS